MKILETNSLRPSQIISYAKDCKSVSRTGYGKLKLSGISIYINRTVIILAVAFLAAAFFYYLICYNSIAEAVQKDQITDKQTSVLLLYVREAFKQNLTFAMISIVSILTLTIKKIDNQVWVRNFKR